MYIDNPIGNTPNNGDNTDNSSKTVLFEETVTTSTSGAPVAQAELAYSQYIDADTIYVTFDGTTYTCQKRHDDEEGANYYGAPTVDGRVDFSTIPFSISSNSTNENYIATQTAGTHTVKVEVESSGGGGASLGALVQVHNMFADLGTRFMVGDSVVVDVSLGGDKQMEVAGGVVLRAYKFGNSYIARGDVLYLQVDQEEAVEYAAEPIAVYGDTDWVIDLPIPTFEDGSTHIVIISD